MTNLNVAKWSQNDTIDSIKTGKKMTETNANIDDILKENREKIQCGGSEKYHDRAKAANKLFCRKRIELLTDKGLEWEDGMWANILADGLPADGVVTGVGRIDGKQVAIIANDSTVKAGSWGWRTVEKIIRIQEKAEELLIPLIYLIDSAGARITDQLEMFPGRRGAGKIFDNQVRLSGMVPQVCLLFGPSAAGGAYIPAFCDVVVMVSGNASMYLGSPRMAEMVIGEIATLEEMGGARMHCSVSGCGDVLVKTEEEAIDWCRNYMTFFPASCHEKTELKDRVEPKAQKKTLDELIPKREAASYDMRKVIHHLVDDSEFVEIKKLFAKEMLTGFARLGGRTVGIIASQPKHLGGVIFIDSADKAAKFITLCDAFEIPLLFLADVPGFMIGTKVEHNGIIRHGAKLISAMASASVPKISVVVRKAYGAGLYAMCGPGFSPDCTIALPEASIAVMGPEPAVNAVFARKIESLPEEEREAFVAEKRDEYRKDIDIYRLASELIIDELVVKEELRETLITRFDTYSKKKKAPPNKKRSVTPV